MGKFNIIFLIGILLSSIVLAEKNIEIPQCVGMAHFRIDRMNITQDEIIIKGCSFVKKSNISVWYDCLCADNSSNIITFVGERRYNYPITYEYYIDNTQDKRIKYVEVDPVPPAALPPSSSLSADSAIKAIGTILLIGLFLALVTAVCITAYYFYYKRKKEERHKQNELQD